MATDSTDSSHVGGSTVQSVSGGNTTCNTGDTGSITVLAVHEERVRYCPQIVVRELAAFWGFALRILACSRGSLLRVLSLLSVLTAVVWSDNAINSSTTGLAGVVGASVYIQERGECPLPLRLRLKLRLISYSGGCDRPPRRGR